VVKTTGPAVAVEELGPVDVVLGMPPRCRVATYQRPVRQAFDN
jgi:hypothetical protein